MIFPAIRISDLERDVAVKKANFNASSSRLINGLKEQAEPHRLLKKNLTPAFIVSGLFLFSSFLFGKSALRFLGGGVVGRLIKMGWAWKFVGWAATFLFKTFAPSMSPLLKALVKSALKNFKI